LFICVSEARDSHESVISVRLLVITTIVCAAKGLTNLGSSAIAKLFSYNSRSGVYTMVSEFEGRRLCDRVGPVGRIPAER
jgi:hypothetical protein